MTTEKNDLKGPDTAQQSKDRKQPWVTPQAKEYDPNKATESGFAPSGADSGIYS